MSIGMTRIHHVKIPVTDLGRSVAWYARLLDLVPCREFTEHGALRGAALCSPEAGVLIALRQRQFCASQPDLAGFDIVALHMASREALARFAARCDRLGIEHSPVQDRGPEEAVVDVPDPGRHGAALFAGTRERGDVALHRAEFRRRRPASFLPHTTAARSAQSVS
jgi:catechol 2,3-dioxygenase-like lactoylglutathione lyase family enzyme